MAEQHINTLLLGVLHPDSKARWTAKDVVALKWLQAAATSPLPDCPEELKDLLEFD